MRHRIKLRRCPPNTTLGKGQGIICAARTISLPRNPICTPNRPGNFPGRPACTNLSLCTPPPGRAPKFEYVLHPQAWELVQEPFGIDTFVLIASRTKLPGAGEGLGCDAVRTRGGEPSGWSVRRAVFESVAR